MSGLSDKVRRVAGTKPCLHSRESEWLLEAADLLDQYEKALEAADELAEAAMASPVVQHEDGPMIDYAAYGRRVATAHAAYQSARATSTKEDG